MSGGIEGRWATLHNEREELREENQLLQRQMADLEAEVEELREVQDSDLAQVVAERNALRRQIEDLPNVLADQLLGLDETKQEAMDHVRTAYEIISTRWKLKANPAELTAACHVLQSFIAQHMLSRLDPARWTSWWEDETSD